MKEFFGLFFFTLVVWFGIILFFGQFLFEGTWGIILVPVLIVSILGTVMMEQDKRIQKLEKEMKRLTWTDKNEE